MNVVLSQKYPDVMKYIREKGQVSVCDLADNFYISSATIRRLLNELEEKGLVRRFHGGVRLTDPLALASVGQRSVLHLAEKRCIGRMASELVHENMTVMMLGGTTVQALAPFLRGKRITVITNSVAVLGDLWWEPNIQIILLGGAFNAEEQETRGALTEHGLSRLRADILFIGVAGVHPQHGLLTNDPNSVGTYLRCKQVSDRMVALADSTKFTRFYGTTTLFQPGEYAEIITDTHISVGTCDSFRAQGIRIHLAECSEPVEEELESPHKP